MKVIKILSKEVNYETYAKKNTCAIHINPIQDGVWVKRPPTTFPPETSTNVGISSQNFLTFSFNPFATLR